MVPTPARDPVPDAIRLSRPSLGDPDRLMAALTGILASGYLSQGRYVAALEERLADYLGSRHAIAVSSGTAALHLALVALGLGPGDEVIVPAYTFPATANVVALVGARPVLVEVEAETCTLRPESLARAVSPRTRAIIPVHLFGAPADMAAVLEIAGRYGLWVIEDAAGALGSTYRGRRCGTLGHIGCFSLHPRKLVTSGEGGVLVTADAALAEKIRALRSHGLEWSDGSPDLRAPGFNYRLSEIAAAVGLNQLSVIDQIVAERQALASVYREALRAVPHLTLQGTLPETTPVWQALVVRAETKDNQTLLTALRRKGIEATIGTYALPLLTYYREKYGYRPQDFPITYYLSSHGLALPFYNGMDRASMDRVVSALTEAICGTQ